MIEVLVDQFICVNEKCMQENIIYDGDGDPID